MQVLTFAKWNAMRGSEELRQLNAKYRFICRPERNDVFELIPRETEKEKSND
jgi:hypothetical protein